MEDIGDLLLLDNEVLLGTLPVYQQDIIKNLIIKNKNNYIESSDDWLNAAKLNIENYGGVVEPKKNYRHFIEIELKKFLCGDKKYTKQRNDFQKHIAKGEAFLISSLTLAIAPSVGAAAAFIGPVVVLLLMNIGKININAWCAMQDDNE